MKKIILIFMMIIMSIGLCACHAEEATEKKKITVVTTIFPIYDWTANIISGTDHIELSMLMDSGADLHSYQPTADDILKIKECDLFIYTGGESDEWIEDIDDDINSISLMEILSDRVKIEETVEGMQHNEDEDEENDEHVWLSLKNASVIVEYIAETLEEIDPDHQDIYQKNADEYIKQLNELDMAYEDVVSKAEVKTMVFADRFPFRYLCDDYNLNYYAAFSGCSAESEASFETIIFLSKKIDELSLRNIMIIESSDGRIAETVKENTSLKNQQILRLNSMQSCTSKDIGNISYLSVMKENLEVLKEALKGE